MDQKNVTEDLKFLPIFLSACNRLLVFPGPTYARRLWCVLELFVFFEMKGEAHGRQLEVIPLEGAESLVRESFSFFSVADCQCFLPGDREALLRIVEGVSGGLAAFDAKVQRLLRVVTQRTIEAYGRVPEESVSDPGEHVEWPSSMVRRTTVGSRGEQFS